MGGPQGSPPGADHGFFIVFYGRVQLRMLASSGTEEIQWEHVSVSTHVRCPHWEEMAWVKEQFWTDEEAVMQLHPRKSDYVNCHQYCLHLWRPWPSLGVILLPPKVALV